MFALAAATLSLLSPSALEALRFAWRHLTGRAR